MNLKNTALGLITLFTTTALTSCDELKTTHSTILVNDINVNYHTIIINGKNPAGKDTLVEFEYMPTSPAEQQFGKFHLGRNVYAIRFQGETADKKITMQREYIKEFSKDILFGDKVSKDILELEFKKPPLKDQMIDKIISGAQILEKSFGINYLEENNGKDTTIYAQLSPQ